MPRPQHLRHVSAAPHIQGFKPLGIPLDVSEALILQLDELEALRLADQEGLYQESAASRMGISRVTFGRILQQARTKVATALVEGRGLLFGTGPVLPSAGPCRDTPCPIHGGPRRRGRNCHCGSPSHPSEP